MNFITIIHSINTALPTEKSIHVSVLIIQIDTYDIKILCKTYDGHRIKNKDFRYIRTIETLEIYYIGEIDRDEYNGLPIVSYTPFKDLMNVPFKRLIIKKYNLCDDKIFELQKLLCENKMVRSLKIKKCYLDDTFKKFAHEISRDSKIIDFSLCVNYIYIYACVNDIEYIRFRDYDSNFIDCLSKDNNIKELSLICNENGFYKFIEFISDNHVLTRLNIRVNHCHEIDRQIIKNFFQELANSRLEYLNLTFYNEYEYIHQFITMVNENQSSKLCQIYLRFNLKLRDIFEELISVLENNYSVMGIRDCYSECNTVSNERLQKIFDRNNKLYREKRFIHTKCVEF